MSREGDWYIMPVTESRDEKGRFRYGEGELEVHGLVLSKLGGKVNFLELKSLSQGKTTTGTSLCRRMIQLPSLRGLSKQSRQYTRLDVPSLPGQWILLRNWEMAETWRLQNQMKTLMEYGLNS